MHEHYGIDVSEPGLLEQRSARWLRVRLVGLLTVESRLRRAMFPARDGAP